MTVCGPHCGGCVNAAHGGRIIPPDGDGTSGIMLVGDSPWKDEQVAGRVFTGAAGDYLGKVLERMGIKRDTLTIANSMWCSPPTLGWTDYPERYPAALSALRQCEPYLDELIAARKPSVIVPMGVVALRRICDVRATIEARHSYPYETHWGIPAVPTFHPSGVMQGKQKLTPAMMFAIRRAQEIADGTYRATDLDLLLDAPPDRVRAYARNNGKRIELMMVDIETPRSADLDEEEMEEAGLSYNIDRAGFSTGPGTGCSFPWREPYITILQEAMNNADTIAEWATNHFDTKRLRAAGLRIPGRIISGLWGWHFLQSDLLKGLGFVAPFYYAGPPFKHMGSVNPALYNAMDNAVGRMCTVGALEGLKREGRLDAFMRHCVAVDGILVTMGQAGAVVDQSQQSQFMARMKEELRETGVRIQLEVPDAIKPVAFRKKAPKELDGWEEVIPPPIPDGLDMKDALKVLKAAKETMPPGEFKSAKARLLLLKNPFRWRRVKAFNPNSTIQLKDLIRSFGLKVPKARGEDKETTEAKHLRRFAKKHPVFLNILLYKQRGKLLSTYFWKLDAAGRVHTNYSWNPSTWRKASYNYNLQNIPKRSDLADEFRRMIVAAPGHVLIETDSSAIEAVLVGYAAGSERYIRLSKAGLHGWMTAAYHGDFIPIELPFGDLVKRCKAAKRQWPTDYEVLKRVDHLSNYLGSPHRIYEEYPDEFASDSAARKLQDFYFSTPPGGDVRRWQQATVELAQRNGGWLVNHFGYKHYFYELYKWNKRRGEFELGDDAKRAIAFVPQSEGSAIQTEILLALWEVPGFRDWLRLIIHDSIISEVPEEQLEYAATHQHWAFIQPWPQLGGLAIGAETKFGRNLGAYNAVSNPGGMQEMSVEDVD